MELSRGDDERYDLEEKDELFTSLLNYIENNKFKKEHGGYNSIPFGFNRFDELVAGWVKGRYYCITAGSGVGKTKLAKFLALHQAIKFVQNNPDSNIDVRFVWFGLEESQTDFYISILAYLLFSEYGIQIDTNEIQSFGKTVLADKYLDSIKGLREQCQFYIDRINFVEDVDNPFGIYKYILRDLQKYGKFFNRGKKVNIFETKNGVEKLNKFQSFNFDDNPKELYYFTVIDHISLISPEKGDDLHKSMNKLSKYFMELCKKCKIIAVPIQQQAAAQESIENIKLDKLEPSLAGLADNKTLQRDYHFVVSLYDPSRHEQVTSYKGYNIKDTDGKVNFIKVLKNRHGVSNKSIAVAAYKGQDTFYEAPKSDDTIALKLFYEALKTNSYRA